MYRRGEKLKYLDWVTILLTLSLMAMGIFNVASAEYNGNDFHFFDFSSEHGRQMMWCGIALFLGVSVLLVEGHFIMRGSFVYYIIVMIMLVAVLFMPEVNGARSWFGVGGFGIQPSEFAKPVTALALARYLTFQNIKHFDFRSRVIATIIIGLPAMLIALQPDAGTLIVFTSFLLVLYREGMSGNILFAGIIGIVIGIITLLTKDNTFSVPFTTQPVPGPYAVIGVIVSIALFFTLIVRLMVNKRERKPYFFRIAAMAILAMGVTLSVEKTFEKLPDHQKTRINLFLGLEQSEEDDYNRIRAMAAVGSGGFNGKGYHDATLANATHKHVPEQTTDFIFCTLGEEWGFLGAGMVLVLYLALIFRIIFVAERQRARFNRIYGYSVACILFYHLLVNVGMVIGLAPVVGIPLPFFSYGGSSVMAFTLMIFTLVSLDAERKDVLR